MSATYTFAVTGMHCGSCSGLIDDEVGDLAGVESSTTSVEAGTTTVVVDESVVRPEDVVAAITSAGDFTATPA